MDKSRYGTVEERRPAVRVFVDLEARYTAVGFAEPLPARVCELSASGLRLRTTERLSVGTLVDIVFQIDDRARRVRARVTMRARARVVRTVLDDDPTYECALRVDDDEALKSALRQAVLDINLSAHPDIVRF